MTVSPPAGQGRDTTAARAAAVFTKHSSVYAAGSFAVLVLSLGNTVVLTQFLRPAEFGHLGLALVSSSFLTLAINAPLLTGALSRAFGGAEEADDDVSGAVAADTRKSFGTAVTVTTLVAVAITGLVIAGVAVARASGHLAGDAGTLVVLAAVSGCAGAIWRLVSSPLRMQRRPVGHVVLSCARPVFVLGIGIPLVAAGGGAPEALAGVAFGTIAANGLAAFAVRRTLSVSVDRTELAEMRQRSIGYLPILGGVWIVQNADLYLMAAFASAHAVGEYRLASRLGATASYASSAFLTAWGPLQLSQQFKDADEKYGHTTVRSTVAFYFVLLSIGILLALTLFALELDRLAPDAYADAAILVPLLGLSFTAQGFMVTAYRSAAFPRKGRHYRIAVLLAGVMFVPVCIALVAAFGALGAALSATVVLLPVAAYMLVRSARAGAGMTLPLARVAVAAAAAAALVALARMSVGAPAGTQIAAHCAAMLAYLGLVPFLLPASHRQHVRMLVGTRRRVRAATTR